ncbi:MAG: DUF2125 domain-containing protein [Bauldia sp.]
MNRLVLVGATAIIVLGLLVFVLTSGGGGGDPEPPVTAETPAVPLAEPAAAADPAAAVDAPAAGAGADAHPTLVAWTAALAAAGVEATYEDPRADGTGVFVRDVVVSGAPEGLPWRWSAPQAAIRPGADGQFEVQPTAPFEFGVTVAGEERTIAVAAGNAVMSSVRGIDGALTALTVALADAELRRGDGEAITIGSGRITIALPEGPRPLPAGSTIGIWFENMVVPAAVGGGLGTAINVLTATLAINRAEELTGADVTRNWMAGFADATLTGLSLRWGRLEAEGTGALTIDAEGRPEGEIQLAAPDILTVLDGIHSAVRFDETTMADVYAAILLAMRDDPSAPVPVTVAVRGGEILLLGAPLGTADLVLGTVGPLLP